MHNTLRVVRNTFFEILAWVEEAFRVPSFAISSGKTRRPKEG